jgi:hypothetical protein
MNYEEALWTLRELVRVLLDVVQQKECCFLNTGELNGSVL